MKKSSISSVILTTLVLTGCTESTPEPTREQTHQAPKSVTTLAPIVQKPDIIAIPVASQTAFEPPGDPVPDPKPPLTSQVEPTPVPEVVPESAPLPTAPARRSRASY